jgi:hypothetical protein
MNPHVAIDLLKISPYNRGAGVMRLAGVAGSTLVARTCGFGISFPTTSVAMLKAPRQRFGRMVIHGRAIWYKLMWCCRYQRGMDL